MEVQSRIAIHFLPMSFKRPYFSDVSMSTALLLEFHTRFFKKMQTKQVPNADKR